ncbi:hypothetical protein [Chromobacterium violaceum]|uniref:hypothetical protein n=1 Tax=Chromobacterium violaceum TaxID=536 RepID=UPI003CF59CA5
MSSNLTASAKVKSPDAPSGLFQSPLVGFSPWRFFQSVISPHFLRSPSFTVKIKMKGTRTGKDALNAVRNNPTLAFQLQQEIDSNKVPLAQISQATALAEIWADTTDTVAVNATMQAEARAEHWPTYSWRPFIGFAFGLLALISGITVAACYLGGMFMGRNPQLLAQLPGMLGAEAGVMATMAPILGIASWFRGKMQADPNIPTDNRG